MSPRGWVKTPCFSFIPQAVHRTAMPISGRWREPYLGWHIGQAFRSHISHDVYIFGLKYLTLITLTSHAAPFSCPCPCLHWERHPICCISQCCVPNAHHLSPWLVRTPLTLWGELHLRVPPFCVFTAICACLTFHYLVPLDLQKYEGFECVLILFLGQVFCWFRMECIPHVDLRQFLFYHHLPLYPSSFNPRFREYCVNAYAITAA